MEAMENCHSNESFTILNTNLFNIDDEYISNECSHNSHSEDRTDNKFILLEHSKSYDVYSEDDWSQIIGSKKCYNFDKIIRSLSNGVNETLREKIWKFLIKSYNIMANHEENLFQKLLRLKNPEVDSSIAKDLNRTPIKGSKSALFNILKAYALYDKEVSYCQGTNFIVMVLLQVISKPADAFWVFIQLMYEKDWRSMFTHETPKLLRCLDSLEKRIKSKLYSLYVHFELIGVSAFYLVY